MNSRFTQKAEIALNKSVIIAEELGHTYIGTEHILIAISEDESSCASVIMKKFSLTNIKIYDSVKRYSGVGKRTQLTSKETTPRCRKILENSYKNAKKFSSEKIGTEHLLLSILEEKESVALKILNFINVNVLELKDDTIAFLRTSEKTLQRKKSSPEATTSPFLKKYAKNMNKAAISKGYDPVIGREGEIDRLIRILSRRNKNSPCLIGEAGVGKTAVVEGLAQKIADGDAPGFLRGKAIYSVDFTAMIAGAKYRGDFEERIKGLIDEARENPDIILFIDEIHTIVGAGSAEGAIDAANIMKPELARGDIRVIGATTLTEYKKYIEKDSALERRFQPIIIEEPSRDKAINILYGLKYKYEEHHGVVIDDSAIEAAVDLSIKYITDRFLPDKAIDILDEACAKESISSSDKNQEKTRYYYDKLRQSYSCGFEFCENDIFDKEESLDQSIVTDEAVDYLKSYGDLPMVTANDIYDVVSEIIGSDNINNAFYSKINDVFEYLTRRVIGQDDAIKALSDSIMRSSCGLCSPDKPKGIFLFVGSSGVGKTELAKECANILFESDDALIRLDMSEYSESYSTSKLIGSAPGYVGYDERITVFEKIRKRPNCVLLLDEIEKAHPDVISLFLQIFDYGFIKDSTGKKINFRNTYIIMTSNVGSNLSCSGVGFMENRKSFDLDGALKSTFKSEFINRIDEIILFNNLCEDNLATITSNKLDKALSRLKDFPFDFSICDDVISYIAKKALQKGMGARPIDRIISKEIEAPLAKLILDKKTEQRSLIRFEMKENKIDIIKQCPQYQN